MHCVFFFFLFLKIHPSTCKIYFLPSTYKDFIYMYCWLQERSFDPVAFNINVFCESHWKHGQNMQLKDDAVYYCARESQHHKPLGDLNFLYWPNSCFFRSPEEALQDHKWILKLCDFFFFFFFPLRWILKLILKMSQNWTHS